LWRMIPLVALFAALLLVASVVFLDSTSGGGSYRAVVGVRHAAEIEAPRAARTRHSPTMIASYLDYSLAGAVTASGEPFDPQGYTAAHRTLPLGTRLLVSYGGKSVRVTVNDRGPHVAGYDLDLSLAAARKIGLTGPGTAPVQVTVL
jgi:rare lipoprotein A